MEDPQKLEERGVISSTEEAAEILRLEDVVKLGQWAGTEHPVYFFSNQIIPQKEFLESVVSGHPRISRASLEPIAEFLRTPDVEEGIRDVHRKIYAPMMTAQRGGYWFTNIMLVPLLRELITVPKKDYQGVFEGWQKDWARGIDPPKFRLAMEILFRFLSKAPKEVQEKHSGKLAGKLLQESEGEFLSRVFERVYGEIQDKDTILGADKRNRRLVEKIRRGELRLTPKDLFHTTNLGTLPLIVDGGILARECASFTQDSFHEATFSISFWVFNKPPQSIEKLGESLKLGRETIHKIAQKATLVILNPTELVEEDHILYPPDSFWYDKDKRSNKIAGRYIAGYDSSSDRFPNRSIAYVLIGLPSTAISFVLIEEELKESYRNMASKFPFYIPAYSYGGQLLFGPEEYDSLSRRSSIEASLNPQVESILTKEDFQPATLVAFLKQPFPDLVKLYEAPAGVWEGYTIEQHTVMVMRQFERYFADGYQSPLLNKKLMRIMLALHDIGKPLAIKEAGNKRVQHKYTLNTITPILGQLGINKQEVKIMASLISQDSIGDYIKGWVTLEQISQSITQNSNQLGIDRHAFLDLLIIYYMSDASAYTEDAGGEKSLDSLFVFNRNAGANKGNIRFSAKLQSKIDKLITNFAET